MARPHTNPQPGARGSISCDRHFALLAKETAVARAHEQQRITAAVYRALRRAGADLVTVDRFARAFRAEVGAPGAPCP